MTVLGVRKRKPVSLSSITGVMGMMGEGIWWWSRKIVGGFGEQVEDWVFLSLCGEP